MNKLLHAGFSRLFMNRLFWLCCAALLAFGALIPLITDANMPLDKIFFAYPIVVGILLATLAGLLLSTEYGEGTIRNKLVAGHKRQAIYLSNLIICAVAGILMQLCFTLAICAVGIPRLGLPELGLSTLLYLYLISILCTLTLAALYTMLGMLITRRSGGVVVSILLAVLLVVFGAVCSSRLNEPEYFDSYFYSDATGNVAEEGKALNTNYLTGAKREVYQFIYDLQPMGQALQLTTMEMTCPDRLPLYSLLVIALTTGVGVAVFRKKDIN